MRLYRYIGPKQIADRAPRTPGGVPVRSAADVVRWTSASGQRLDADRCVIATFVVDVDGALRIADRRSEHVACAGNQAVRTAGEIRFQLAGDAVEVVAASNQSTGYCPEPESWSALQEALSAAGLNAPPGFDPACVFRVCAACGAINLVKDSAFECGVCGADLPAEYNCQSEGE